jgi:valyl-tRNA synthetase
VRAGEAGGGAGATRVQLVIGEAVLLLDLGAGIDLARERARLAKDREKAEREIARLAAKLANEGFLRHAEEAVVDEHRDRLAAEEATRAKLDASLARIA